MPDPSRPETERNLPAPARPGRGWALGAAALAFAIAATAGVRLDGLQSETARITPIFFPRVEIVRPALLGFHNLAADLWWLRTIQYFGGRVEREEQFPQLYQLVDMVTSLDSGFLDAYRYGGLFLVIARQYPQAIQIYKKGIAAYPHNPDLPHDLGRLYFLELKDDAQALYWWEIANRLPGRPHYLPRFIARLYAKTGHLDTALELWKSMRDTATNEWVRKTAAQEIAKILARMRTPAGPAHP
jgi:tetratricopeptide (TPR) repeat protein